MNLLREGSAKVMFASEKGINNFTESQTIQSHEELQKHIKELLRKEQLIPYENKNQIESDPTGLSDVQWGLSPTPVTS